MNNVQRAEWLSKHRAQVEWFPDLLIMDVFGQGVVVRFKDYKDKAAAWRAAVDQAMKGSA